MGEEKIIDQSKLANDVASKIPYEFTDSFLVKLLDPIKVKKEFQVPVSKDETPKKDKNGIEAVDFDETKTETKELDSDYRKGVVLKVPYSYTAQLSDEKISYVPKINVGDIVLFSGAATRFFDLLKDSKLVRQYDIIAIEK